MLIILYKYYSFRIFNFLHPLEDIQLSVLQSYVKGHHMSFIQLVKNHDTDDMNADVSILDAD